VQRLDAGNLDVGIGPQLILKAGENDAGIDAVGDQFVAGLRDDLAPMGDHQNAVVALDRAIDDLRAYDGLAGPRGGDIEQPALALRDFALDLIDGVPLEGVQLDRDVLLEQGRQASHDCAPSKRNFVVKVFGRRLLLALGRLLDLRFDREAQIFLAGLLGGAHPT
jgi:hypothetical protein